MKNITITIVLLLLTLWQVSTAQTAVIKGRVFNPINNESLPFVNVVIQGSTIGTSSDLDGNFEISGLEPKLYNLEASSLGYKKVVVYEIQTYNNKPVFVNIEMVEDAQMLDAVVITSSAFSTREEAPVSMRTIGVSEIERNPGGNRDISRVIQSLPGVASSPTFRNDIIIRGGAPNENRFFLDGIEVPNINHFATQGASGGPVGLINVNFINEVEFYSSSFPANRGNALSSVFDFSQKDGNSDGLRANITVGSSDYGLTLDGPLAGKTTYIFSVRRSYLQFLFSALKLPFLPIYNDSQFKIKTRLNDKNEISLIGLGALDQFELNQDANKGVTDAATLERNRYILGNIASNEQWNYTIGATYKHFADKSFQLFVISRNHLNNTAVKYRNNDESLAENLILNYASQEIENKLRLEHTWRNNGWKWNLGAGYEAAIYTNDTYNKIVTSFGDELVVDFSSRLFMNKYSAFSQLSKSFLSDALKLSFGIRTDASDYNDAMANPLKQLSPRFSVSYAVLPRWNVNGSAGRYHQLPPYTVLGYRDSENNLVNKQNGVTYIRSDHAVLGLEYLPASNTRITVEGFFKQYAHYPFLLRDSISLANMGSDFGVVGNEPVVSESDGRAYGVEFLAQQKLFKGFYGIVAYTWVVSAFEDRSGKLVPSAWDNGNIVTLTGGKKFKGDWEIGARFRYLGGAPYTPYDIELSALKSSWDVRGVGVMDYALLNTRRNGAVHQLDVRVDKRFFFEKWSLNLYLDVQNVYNYQAPLSPFLTVERDESGEPLTDPNDASRYLIKEVPNFAGTLLPSVGIVVEL